MKQLMFFILMMTFVSCETFRIKNEDDDESISGTVSLIWSQVTLASAYAATPAEELTTQSSEILKSDFFSSADKSDYEGAVTSGLANIESLLNATSGLITNNYSSFAGFDFEYGVGISVGYNADKKIVSLQLSAIDENGKYSFTDAAVEKVRFYKIIFLLNKSGSAEYRLSYVERTGKKINEDVTFATTSASVKVTRELTLNAALPISQIRSKVVSYKNEIDSNIVSEDEKTKIWAVAATFHNGVDSSNLHESTFLTGSIYLAICANPSLKSAVISRYDYWIEVAIVARPAPELRDVVRSGEEGEVIVAEIEAIIEELVSSGLISEEEPSDGGGGGMILEL